MPALSTADIESIAGEFRKAIGVPEGGIRVIKLIEFVLPRFWPDFVYNILDDGEMDFDEARTYPDQNRIDISSSTYNAAMDGDGRANFTLAHELGHLCLHRGISTSFSRASSASDPLYKDSEWQADAFSAAFLMPKEDVLNNCSDEDDVMARFYTSRVAARTRLKKVRKK